VRVLFRLGNTQLGFAQAGDVVAKGIDHRLRRVGAMGVEACFVFGGHHKVAEGGARLTAETAEVVSNESVGQLTGAVGAEVHKQYRITIPDERGRFSLFDNQGWLDELVAFAALIGGLKPCRRSVGNKLRLPQGQHIVHRLNPLPAVVPVHGVIATGDAGDCAFANVSKGFFDQLDGGLGAFGWRVATIEKAVQVDFVAAATGGQLDGGHQVVFMAVNAALGQEAENMHSAPRCFGLVDGVAIHRVGEKVAVGNGFVNTGEILVDHPPGAEGHMAHFGVAHLPLGQSNSEAGGGDQRFWLMRPQAVPHRGVGGVDGVEFGGVIVSPAVEDDQYRGFFAGGHFYQSLHGFERVRMLPFWVANNHDCGGRGCSPGTILGGRGLLSGFMEKWQ